VKVNEGRKLAEERLEELSVMALPDLGRFVDAAVEELIEGPSGRSYRLQIDSFSKPEEKDSHAHVRIRLRGLGWRRYQRYTGAVLRVRPKKRRMRSLARSQGSPAGGGIYAIEASWSRSLHLPLCHG
jgi:hypothetical protein